MDGKGLANLRAAPLDKATKLLEQIGARREALNAGIVVRRVLAVAMLLDAKSGKTW